MLPPKAAQNFFQKFIVILNSKNSFFTYKTNKKIIIIVDGSKLIPFFGKVNKKIKKKELA